MELVNAVVAALALGAAALQEVSAEAVEDAYGGLQALIQSRYAQISLAQLEANPESRNQRGVVEEELAVAGAEHDEELLRQAKALMDAVQRHAPQTAVAIGVDLEEIKGAALRIGDVIASGVGVKVRKGDFSGDIDISGVVAGQHGANPAKKA
jgi:hypothetical protein